MGAGFGEGATYVLAEQPTPARDDSDPAGQVEQLWKWPVRRWRTNIGVTGLYHSALPNRDHLDSVKAASLLPSVTAVP